MKALGSNQERRAALVATIDARILNINSFMLDGQPADLTLPRNLFEFRQMDFPELGIFPILSPSTLNEKQNPQITNRILEIKRLLNITKKFKTTTKPKSVSLSEANRRLRRKVREQSLTIAGLARSYHEHEVLLENLELALRKSQKELSNLKKVIRDLQVKKTAALHVIHSKST